MAYLDYQISDHMWQNCVRCGQRITLLRQSSAPLLWDHDASERYGFQCLHCGKVTCFNCSDNRFRCTCGGNAWVTCGYRCKAGVSRATN